MLIAIDGGTYYHHRTLHEAPFADAFEATIPIRAFHPDRLPPGATLYLPSRLNADVIAPFAPALERFMEAGGTLVAMGETFPERWLNGITALAMETNFWWWLDPSADLKVRATPASTLADRLSPPALTWHLHGTYDLRETQRSLVEADGKPILFDERRGEGRLIATTLDACYHHGSHFMPATTAFLEGFLPWLRAGAP